MSTPPKTIIELKCREQGLSLSDLASITNIPPTTLSRILYGTTKKVKKAHIDTIADALGCSPEDLTGEDEFITMSQATSCISPDDAGKPIIKKLTASESALLYLYQNCTDEKKQILINAAHRYFISAQKEMMKQVKESFESEKEPEFSLNVMQIKLDF